MFRSVTLSDFTVETFESVFSTNVLSQALAFKYQIPAMGASGDKGSIIVNTSCVALRATPRMTGGGIYSASKAAAEMLVKYGAIEVRIEWIYNKICHDHLQVVDCKIKTNVCGIDCSKRSVFCFKCLTAFPCSVFICSSHTGSGLWGESELHCPRICAHTNDRCYGGWLRHFGVQYAANPTPCCNG
ncbi:unnamed protein product [Choristocarpus tenellus]